MVTTKRYQALAMLLDSALRTWGSREDLWRQFCRALITRGVRPVLVFSEAPDEKLRNMFRTEGIDVEPINYADGLVHYYRELGKVVKKYSVTAVHIAFFSYFDLIPWLARLHGVQYILYQERNPGVLRAKLVKRQLLRMRTRVVAWPMTRVIAISDFIRRQLIEVGIPGRKISLVYHGVDTRRYLPDPSARDRIVADYGIRANEIVLAVLTYMNRPHKNVDTILQACKQLTQRGLAIRLFVIGEGTMRNELQALGQTLGIEDRTHWLGHILDPVPILQSCDIFLMVSEGEGFGLALAEAMACGAAAVAARSGALVEIVEDGISGLLVPPRDASALADAIQKLAENQDMRKDMGRRSLERVRRLFTTEVSIVNTMKVYESMWTGASD